MEVELWFSKSSKLPWFFRIFISLRPIVLFKSNKKHSFGPLAIGPRE